MRFLSRLALAKALIGILALSTMSSAAAQAVTVVVGGHPLALNPGPIERAGRVFVPLRGIFEHLGAGVVYQAGTINATKGSTTVSLQIGSTQATVNGQRQYLDVAPFIVGATTYVPLRFVAQSLGANVGYDNATRVVAITMPHAPPYAPARPIQPPTPPPSIVYLTAQQPAPGANVVNRFVTIGAQFSRPVRPASVRVWLDGNAITNRAGVSASGFSYTPPAPLNFSAHTVRVAGTTVDGSSFDRSWSFTTIGSPTPASPIQLRAWQPAPGTSVANTFTVISAQFSRQVNTDSVRIWLDGNNITNRCGISASGFSYKPPAPLDFGSHNIRVTGNGVGGAVFDRGWTFTITRPTPAHIHLTINQPTTNAAVGRTFVIQGNTVANGRISVTAGATPLSMSQFNGSTTAGPRGNFSITVTLKTLLGQQAVRVRITATDPVTSQNTETTLQLRLNQ